MANQAEDLLIGFALAAVISIISKKARLLTLSGAMAATVVGGAIFGSGVVSLPASLLWFFITSNLLGRFRRHRKESLRYEKSGTRDAGQVLANGAFAATAALLASCFHRLAGPLVCASLAAMCCSAADTWATEVGSGMSSATYLITTFKQVRSGRSGGISVLGSLAALIGAISTSLVAYAFAPHLGRICIIAAVCGFVGSAIDSLLGATVQAQYRNSDGNVVEVATGNGVRVQGLRGFNNDAVNFVSGFLASALAFSMSLQLIS